MKRLLICMLIFSPLLTHAQTPPPQALPHLPGVAPQPAAPPRPVPPQPVPPQPAAPAPQPMPQVPVVNNVDNGPKLPADFEFISISPYFKNKPKLGRLMATVHAATGEVLGTVSGDFGDCKSCIRGASIKGKIGIRVYGKNLQSLTVSRKQSSSIKVLNCATDVPLQNGAYSCEFSSGSIPMKLNLRIDP